jgi:hypothetical protein
MNNLEEEPQIKEGKLKSLPKKMMRMKIFSVHDINYSSKGYSQRRLAKL